MTRNVSMPIAGLVLAAACATTGTVTTITTPLPVSNDPPATSGGTQPPSDTWAEHPVWPDPRGYAAMAYDWAEVVSVMFGGQLNQFDMSDETWHYDHRAGQWERIVTSGPPPRAAHAMAYDVAAKKMVMFGGIASRPTFCLNSALCGFSEFGDTWLYDAADRQWHEIPVRGPSSRSGHRMAYDVDSGVVVLFGGWQTTDPRSPLRGTVFDDTWVFDTEEMTWQEMTPEPSPPPRAFQLMAYDEASDRVVMWGGAPAKEIDTSVWAYDFESNTWTEQPQDLDAPHVRHNTSFVYDQGAGRLLTVGGVGLITTTSGRITETSTDWFDELWAYDLATNSWQALPGPGGGLTGHATSFDRLDGRLLWFGGAIGIRRPWDSLLEFDPTTNEWTDLTRSGS
ncbi:MAG: kelch repeat-containing protein [Acidimicrobiia bacterium]